MIVGRFEAVNNNPVRASVFQEVAAWSQLAWLAGITLVWSGLLFAFSVDPDYTAGELVDHLQAWRETGVLYPALGDLPPLRVLNYPPLVLVLARGVAALGLGPLAAGRIVDAIGLVALLAGAAWWARARGARGAALAGTVGLLGASFPLLYGAGQFHIELWASAGTLWGFALLDRARTHGVRAAVLGGAALGLACFAKQSQVVPAVVALAWAWSCRRSIAPALSAAFAAAGAIGTGAITAAWGAEPWRQMVTYTVGTYSLTNLAAQIASHLAPWAILLALAATTWRSERTRAAGDPLWWLWIGSLLWSLASARVGSGYPYFLDVHVATALLVGPRIFGAAASRFPTPFPAWLLALQVIGADLGVAGALAVNATRLARTQAELPALCARVATVRELVTEEAGLARACGRPALVHPFITTSLAAQGLWDAEPFERALRDGEYDGALLPFDPRRGPDGVHAERWSAGEAAAFRAAAVVEPVATGRWLVRW